MIITKQPVCLIEPMFPDNIVVRAAAVLSAVGASVVVPVAGLLAVQAVVEVVT